MSERGYRYMRPKNLSKSREQLIKALSKGPQPRDLMCQFVSSAVILGARKYDLIALTSESNSEWGVMIQLTEKGKDYLGDIVNHSVRASGEYTKSMSAKQELILVVLQDKPLFISGLAHAVDQKDTNCWVTLRPLYDHGWVTLGQRGVVITEKGIKALKTQRLQHGSRVPLPPKEGE